MESSEAYERACADSLQRVFGPVHTLVARKYYMDDLYEGLIVREGLYNFLTRIGQWFDTNIVDDNIPERVIKRRLCLVFKKRMNMDALFLVFVLRPEERRVRAPDLNAAGVFRLLDVQFLRGRREIVLPKAYDRAVIRAMKETRLARSRFPEHCPYTLDDLLSEGWEKE